MRRQEGLPAVAVYWPDSRRKEFTLRHSLQILDTVLTGEDDDIVVVVTEEKCDGSKSKGIFSLQYTVCILNIKM